MAARTTIKSFEFLAFSFELGKGIFDNSKLSPAIGGQETQNSKFAPRGRGAALFLAALMLAGAAWTQEQSATAAFDRGKAHAEKYEWEESVAAYEEAARLYEAMGEKSGAAAALDEAGLVLWGAGNYSEALQRFEKSMNGTADNAQRARTLNNAAGVYWSMGNFPKSLEYCERSLRIREEMGDRASAAQAISNMGLIHTSMGNHAEALRLFEKALNIEEDAGDVKTAAKTLVGIGMVYRNMGRYEEALRCYGKSMDILKAMEDRAAVAKTLNNIGVVYDELGDYQKGLGCFLASMRIKEELRDKAGVGQSLHNVGMAYSNLGDLEKALVFYERSLAIGQETGDIVGVSQTLNDLGLVYANLGDYAKARELYEKSLRIKEETGNRSDAAGTLANLCDVNFGSPEERIPYGERALQMAKEIEAPERIYGAHAALGAAFAAAAKMSDKQMTDEQMSDEEKKAASASSSAYPPSDHLTSALQHFRSAIAVAEDTRSLLSESEQKSGFLGTKLTAYESLVELLIDGWPLTVDRSQKTSNGQLSTVNPSAEAFSVAERMKARSFLDELGAAKFSRAGVSEELLQEKRLLEARIKWLKEKI